MIQPKEITTTEFDAVKLLTNGELAILTQFGRGMTTDEIAKTKGAVRSKSTVEAHVFHIRTKLDLPDSAKLRVFAARFLAFQEKYKVTITREKTHLLLILNP